MFTVEQFKHETHKIVQNYLYRIGLLSQRNVFTKFSPTDYRIKYHRSNAFALITNNNDNAVIVSSQNSLEGCTRVFLVNPIFKILLENMGYQNDWQFGTTFNNSTLTNREYENGSFVEFIFENQGKKIGCRYTPNNYSSEELSIMNRNHNYVFNKQHIMGFDNLQYIDQLICIDWSGISSDELAEIHKLPSNAVHKSSDMSLKDFFDHYLGYEFFDPFISLCENAINTAQKIISLKAIPQLSPSNILQFKELVLKSFSDELRNKHYIFHSTQSTNHSLSDEDISIMNRIFFDDKRFEAIIGTSLFAKSFITSEYLFQTINNNLSIDYTSIVAGYLKSVEQLLYLYYLSAFGNEDHLFYWDTCNKIKDFNPTLSNKYRYDPYSSTDKSEPQEFYYHKKKTDVKAPTIGALSRFIRYYPQIWNISEEGKEYIFSCLEDYCLYCRNHHFHKDNIEFSDYDKVLTIRNNTMVCLYYLLGGFKLLDNSKSEDKQLCIENYSFEKLYLTIPLKRGVWNIKTGTGYEGIGYFSILDYSMSFEALENKDKKIVFVECDANTYGDNPEKILFDEDYISTHSIVLTAADLPIDLKHIRTDTIHRKRTL